MRLLLATLLSLYAGSVWAAPWYFVVTAVNVKGDESAPSNTASKVIDDVAGGSALLTWVRPTQNSDGTAYTDALGYRIYWGTVPSALTSSMQLNEPLATMATVAIPPAPPPQTQIPPPIAVTALVCVPASNCLVPPPTSLLTTSDIGSPALPGSSTLTSGAYTLKAAGADIWGTADQFRFTYATLSGDGEIVARVASLTNTDVWTKAGVMIRDTLQPGSPYVLMMVSSMRGVDMQWRATANGNAQQALSDMTTRAPRWLRLTRAGNVFRGYHSVDGVTWTLYSTQTVPLQGNALVGLALTSHNVAALATGVFDGVVVIDP